MAHLNSAKRAVVVGGSEIARYGLQEKFAELLKLIRAPYGTSPLGKSVLCELRTDVSFAGVYFGMSSQDNLQKLMVSADCILTIGVRDTDFNYLGVVTPDYRSPGTKLPGPDHIQARDGAVLVGRQLAYWGDVGLEALLDALLAALAKLPDKKLPGAPFPRLEGLASGIAPVSIYLDTDPITYDSFKSIFSFGFLEGREQETQIIADSGFSFLSNIGLKCAEGGYIAQLAWAAIGYGVGAIPGVTLANEISGRPRRTVAITGDAAFAESLNALGTVAQLGQDAIIFVMDNRVYAVEQWLIDANAFCPEDATPFAALTEMPQGPIWDYVKLAEGFGGKGHSVKTNGELKNLMRELKQEPAPINAVTKRPTFTLVAVRLPKNSLPANANWKLNCAPGLPQPPPSAMIGPTPNPLPS
jgi:TPP-dependent 2-oxoacid decarboxylase